MARRARTARDAFIERRATLIVACGGRAWSGRVEADVLAKMLEDGGVPAEAIVRERDSLDTHGNATHAARILAQRGFRDTVVVTCSWHLPRAIALFERAGVGSVHGVGAPPPDPNVLSLVWWASRERVSLWKERLRWRVGR